MSNKILMSVAEYNANMSPSTNIIITSKANEYTPEEIQENGNQMYGGKRHDLICDQLEKDGYTQTEVNLVSIGIWKGIESERIVKDEVIREQEKLIADLSKRDEWLSYLEAAGIDNTSAYEYAIKLRNDDNLHSEDDE